METLKSVIGLGGGSKTDDEVREPAAGVASAGTADEPYDQGNVEDGSLSSKAPQHTTQNENSTPQTMSPSETKLGNEPPTTSDSTMSNNVSDVKVEQEDNRINSLFSNPFTRKESISGASKDVPLDPKAVPAAGEEPLPELTLVESAVTIHEPKPVRNPFAPSSRTPSKPVPDTSTAQPKIDKGKGRAIDIPEEPSRNDTPRPATVTDSSSSTGPRSDRTRTESMATFSTATGASTIGSVAGDRRKSYVPATQNNPGNIPLAGGRPIGRKASVQYSQAFQYEPPSAGPSSASREEFKDIVPEPSPRQAAVAPKSTVSSVPQPRQDSKQDTKQSAPAEPSRRKSKGFFGRAKKLLSNKDGMIEALSLKSA